MTAAPALRRLWITGTLVVLLAGDAVRYTIGWWGYIALVLALAGVAAALLVRHRERWHIGDLPWPMLAFVGYATLSIAWSAYPGWSALGVLATALACLAALAMTVVAGRRELLRALGDALRAILGLSVLFEVVVAWVIRQPVLPLIAQPGVDYANLPDRIPLMLFWSRNELFGDAKIQGIVGNSVLLAFVAALALVVFAVQLADRTVRRAPGVLWMLLAAAVVVMTRSATMLLAVAAVVLVAAIVLLLRRLGPGRRRTAIGAGIAALAVGGGTVAIAARDTVFGLLGKGPDLTNRTEIWDAVIGLATQRPAFGWGWVGYWVPWTPPFDDLAFNNGIRQLHAHNAWLDLWLQVGIVGLVLFAAWMLSTLVRAFSRAVDRPMSLRGPAPFRASALLPLLIVVLLLVQSIAESRLLVEGGLVLFAAVSILTKRDPVAPRRNDVAAA